MGAAAAKTGSEPCYSTVSSAVLSLQKRREDPSCYHLYSASLRGEEFGSVRESSISNCSSLSQSRNGVVGVLVRATVQEAAARGPPSNSGESWPCFHQVRSMDRHQT